MFNADVSAGVQVDPTSAGFTDSFQSQKLEDALVLNESPGAKKRLDFIPLFVQYIE